MGQVFSLGNRSLDIHIFMRYCSGGRFLSRQKKKEKQIWVEVGRTGEKEQEVRTKNRPDETNIKRKLRTIGASMLGIFL